MTHADHRSRLDRLWVRALAPDAEEFQPPPADLPFSAAGGHSLAAARIVAGIRSELGRRVSIVDMLRADPTPDQLAAMVDAAPAAEAAGPAEAASAQARTLGRAPLSRQMLPVWAFHRLHPDSPAYNVLRVLTVEGRLQPGALRAAAAALTERHDALRCCVREPRPGHPELIALPSVTPSIGVQVIRLPAGSGPGPEPDWEISAPAEVVAALRAAGDRPFEMANAPLWRIQLVFVPELGRSWLLLATHHLIADLRATDLLLAELAAGYAAALPEAAVAEGTSAGPAEPASLVAHLIAEAAADDSTAGTERRAADLSWWASVLGERAPARPLPLSTGTGLEDDYAGDAGTVELDTGAVQQLARTLRVTNATVLLTAAAIVHAAWRGDPQAVIGVPSARSDSDTGSEPVGYLVTTVPSLVSIDLSRTFAELCRLARESFLDALEHSTVTLGEIMVRLAMPRQSSRSTVLDLWFNDLEHASVPARFGNAPVLEYDLVPSWALFLCGLYVRRSRAGLRLHGIVPRGIMQPADLAAFLHQIRDLIGRCAEHPQRPVRQLLAPDRPPPAAVTPGTPISTAARIEQHAEHRPEAIAVRSADRTVSYAELAADVRQRAAGWTAECRIAFGAKRDYDHVAGRIAAVAAGASVVLIDRGWPVERQRAAIRLSRATHTSGIEPAVQAELAAPAAGLGGVAVQFTSGTTGTPLAVTTSHRIRLACIDDLGGWLGIGAEDRTCFLSGAAHDPSWRDIELPLRAGATLFLPPEAVQNDPTRLAGWLRENRITVVNATPALLNLALAAEIELPDLRLVVAGGAPLPVALVRRIRLLATGATVINGYGCTETPQLLTALRIGAEDELPDGIDLSIGAPFAGRLAQVYNGDGLPCDVGQLGTVWAGAPHIAEGYLGLDGNSAGLASRFVTDRAGLRWFDTGDLARLDAAGRLTLAGRADRQRLVNGHRIVLDEIESVARSRPEVSAAIAEVVGAGSAEALRLFVRPVTGREITEAELRETLRSQLPAAAMPARIVVTPELPVSSNYKLLAPEAGPAGPEGGDAGFPASAGDSALPGTAAIGALAEAILGSALRPTDNFFEAGFDSVTLLHFGAELSGLLHREVPAIALFRYPSLHRLLPHLGVPSPARRSGDGAAERERPPDAPPRQPPAAPPRQPPDAAGDSGGTVRDRRRQLRRSISRQLSGP
jgi:non-ribosomal peptide synthetase component F